MCVKISEDSRGWIGANQHEEIVHCVARHGELILDLVLCICVAIAALKAFCFTDSVARSLFMVGCLHREVGRSSHKKEFYAHSVFISIL